MRSIAEFFSRIQNKHAKQVFLLQNIQKILKDQAGIELGVSNFSFKGGNLIISGLSPGAKSQVFIKKAALLRELSGAASPKVIEDIRFG